jgi:hypothetical protein
MLEFEFAGASAGLVGAQAFDCLGLFVGSEEARGGDVVVEVEVDYWRGDDGYEADEEEDSRGLLEGVTEGRKELEAYICHSWRVSDLMWPRP